MVHRACGKWIAVLALVGALSLPLGAWGEDFSRELGLRVGYGKNDQNATVRLYSLLPRWGMSLIRPGRALGPLGLSFIVEGIVSVADPHGAGWEIGVTPMLKVSARLLPRLTFFIEGGVGIIAENIDSPAIAHTFNFTPQIGAGVDFYLQPRLAWSVAFRFRHSSNAGIYSDNPSFNVNFVQTGLTYYF